MTEPPPHTHTVSYFISSFFVIPVLLYFTPVIFVSCYCWNHRLYPHNFYTCSDKSFCPLPPSTWLLLWILEILFNYHLSSEAILDYFTENRNLSPHCQHFPLSLPAHSHTLLSGWKDKNGGGGGFRKKCKEACLGWWHQVREMRSIVGYLV